MTKTAKATPIIKSKVRFDFNKSSNLLVCRLEYALELLILNDKQNAPKSPPKANKRFWIMEIPDRAIEELFTAKCNAICPIITWPIFVKTKGKANLLISFESIIFPL